MVVQKNSNMIMMSTTNPKITKKINTIIKIRTTMIIKMIKFLVKIIVRSKKSIQEMIKIKM